MKFQSKSPSKRARIVKYLWDFGCAFSIIGIWPRYIEPNLINISHLDLPVPQLPEACEGLKIAQFSDLHLNKSVTDNFLDRIVTKVNNWCPDIIVFTGDFLCHSRISSAERLQKFLRGFSAPLGCYCIFGNHDYEGYVAVNSEGQYDVMDKVPIDQFKGLKRIFCGLKVKGSVSTRLKKGLPLHSELIALLADTPFKILENQSELIHVGSSAINVVGLGEYMVNRFDPEVAFKHYNVKYPGILLAHNPDAIPKLLKYPGDVILCGHVHGGQVNLPWLRKRFVVLENPQYVRGTFHENGKWIHINRGLGGTLRFRLFSSPELSFITLKRVP